jgi:hypothetical protein
VDLELHAVKAKTDVVEVALSGEDIQVDIDLENATDISADLADGDLILVDDGAAGTNRACAMSRVGKYIDTKGTYKTLWVGAGAMTPAETNGAEADTKEFGTNDITVDVMAFAGATADEHADFCLVMPEAWDRGTIKFKVYWYGDSDANADEYVEFYLAAGARSNDDAQDAALGTAVSVADQHITDNDLHITTASAALTVGGSPALGDLIHFKLSRDYDHDGGGTAMDVDAFVLGVLIQYQENLEVSAW